MPRDRTDKLLRKGRARRDKLSPAERALELSLKERPLPGTLGHVLLSHNYDNLTVYSILKQLHEENPAETRITRIINIFDRLGKIQRARAGIWDELCREVKLPVVELLSLLAAYTFKYQRGRVLMAMSMAETDVVAALTEFAQKEENIEDRKTFLRITGLDQKQGGAGINVNVGVGVQVQEGERRGLPSVEDLTTDATLAVREHRQRVLTEGAKDYVDAELVTTSPNVQPESNS